MNIHACVYKGRPAVVIETSELRATLLPEDGAKLASLRRRRDGRELLVVKPGNTYRVLTRNGSYVESECSGFDDMFPTVDPYTPPEGTHPTYPDHGECCRLAHDLTISEHSVTLTAVSPLFPVIYEKTVFPDADGLLFHYRIENRGDTPFPFLWAGHIMLAGEDGMRVITPFSTDTPVEMMFAAPAPSDPAALPRDRLTGHRPGEGTTYKFYYPERLPKGEFGVRYRDGSTLLFTVDPDKLPYLGIWLNNGAFQDLYSITPEPCTVPFDAPDRAAERGYTSTIPAGDAFEFTIHIRLV